MVRWRLSRSIAPTRWPEAASAIAVWTAVVDLPVPPFSLAKVMKCGWPMASSLALDLLRAAPRQAPPVERPIERPRIRCKSSARSEELAARLRRARGRRAAGASCRPWARSTPGISSWSTEAQGAGRHGSSRRSSSIRSSSTPTRTSAAIRGSEAEDLAMLERAGCDLALAADRGRRCIPTASRPRSASRACPTAGKARRRPGHFDGVATVVAKLFIAVAPDVARVRRKGFPAAGGDPADGRGPRPCRSRSSGVPTVRDADGLALSSRNAYSQPRRARARAGAADRARTGARRDPLGASRSGRALGRGQAATARCRASSRSTMSRWSMPRRSSRSTRPHGDDAPDRRGDDRHHPADRQSARSRPDMVEPR